jgi:glycosyltransferase involved in cell wall biosynthesis
MIRLAVDATSVGSRITGLERYARETTHVITANCQQRDIEMDVLLAKGEEWLEPSASVRIHRSSFSSKLITEQLWVPWVLRRLRPDAAFFPAFPPSPLLALTNIRVVKTVHDAVLWQQSDTISWKARLYFRPLETFWISRYSRIHTVSEPAAGDLRKQFPEISPNLVISGNGVDESRFGVRQPTSTTRDALSALGVTKPYILAVGTVEPRKNFPFLVEIFKELVRRGANVELVIAGRAGWGQLQLEQAVNQSGVCDRIHVLGGVDDSTLSALYREAQLLAMPSLQEGFGLPIVEAMASGIPVVASDIPALSAVAGNAALLLPVGDNDRWVEGIEDLVHDPAQRAHLVESGRARSAEFSWEAVGERILDDLLQLVGV